MFENLDNVIHAKLQADKDEGYTEGAKIRQVKNIVHKFNHFLDADNNKLNRTERRAFDKLGSIIGHHKLNLRVNVIHYLYKTMADIERMGYTLFYKIDDIEPENNDFIYCLEYGALRGAKVAEPFKFDKSEYNKLKDHKQIYNLIESEKKAGAQHFLEMDKFNKLNFPSMRTNSNDVEIIHKKTIEETAEALAHMTPAEKVEFAKNALKKLSNNRPLTPAEIRANIANATIKEDSPNHKSHCVGIAQRLCNDTYDASGICEHKITAGNGLTFICDDFGRQLIAEIMGGINDANRARAVRV